MVKHYTAIWRNKDSGMSVNCTYYSRIDDAMKIQSPATFIHNLLLIFSSLAEVGPSHYSQSILTLNMIFQLFFGNKRI